MNRRYVIGQVEVRPDERRVLAGGQPALLGARAFDLLLQLIELRDRVVTKEELLDLVWPGQVVEESNLTVHVSALRKVLGPNAIATIPGRGYRFTMAVEEPPDLAEAAPRPIVDKGELPLPDKPSIAVLPFDNFGGNTEQEFFVDGITEDIITELSRFRWLFVIARNSSFAYKGKAVDVRTVARELGVQYVVEGSVRWSGRRVRVTGQLVDALSGTHLWAERYDRDVDDMFVVQEELTRAIVGALGWQIDSAELQRARKPQPGHPTAHMLAMRSRAVGRVGITESDRHSLEAAIGLAREALAIDPQCIAAWRSIALANWGVIFSNPPCDPGQALHDGLEAARAAIAVDKQDHMAHFCMGLMLSHGGRPSDGLAEMRRAHELNPNDAPTLAMLGQYEAGSGEPLQGIARTVAAQRLSPRDPVGWFYFFSGAMAHFFAGQYDQAADCARRGVADAPRFFNAHMALVISRVGLGDIAGARSHFPILPELAASVTEARLAGHWPYGHAPFVHRGTVFLRIAAGLEDPAKADALR